MKKEKSTTATQHIGISPEELNVLRYIKSVGVQTLKRSFKRAFEIAVFQSTGDLCEEEKSDLYYIYLLADEIEKINS